MRKFTENNNNSYSSQFATKKLVMNKNFKINKKSIHGDFKKISLLKNLDL